MRLAPLDRKLLRDLWHLKGQALAIGAVIGCGVATVIVMFGTLESLSETRQAYYEIYGFADVFAPLKRAPNSLAADIARIPGVSEVSTRIAMDVILDIPEMIEPALARLISVPENGQNRLNRIVLREGRWVSAAHPDEVIVSENLALAHNFKPGDSFSAIINGKKRSLNIVGIALSPEFIYAIGPGQIMPDDRTFGIIWMGQRALEAAFDLEGAFNDVSVSLMHNASEASIIERLDSLLARYGGIGAYGRKDQISAKYISNEIKQLKSMGDLVAPVFLGVAAFLLHIVISRMIDTQRDIIGLLKAFGYTKWEVGRHYLEFVLALTLIGIAFGMVLGIWMGRGLTNLYGDFFRFPFLYYRLDFSVLAWAAFVALASSILGTLHAVSRSVKLAPAVAMRPALPVIYRQSILEKLTFIGRVSAPTRMIWRHFIRWPMRTSLTILGLSLSVGLIIMTLFPLDSIDFIFETYYFKSQRQDAQVTFVEPRNSQALNSMQAMPGVLAAEPFRYVPIKLHYGHLTQRVGLTGLYPDAHISQLLDSKLHPITVPSEGVALSAFLAKKLNVTNGDLVTVETMSGKRPIARMPVTAVVKEYIGMGAYMDARTLDGLMRDGPVISGVRLMIDQSKAPQLYKALKRTPAIAGITLKSAALRSFRSTLAKTIEISIAFYLFFGGMIAFGVVYNSARISLSERARELASLRVLGFTKGEVSFILLGELSLVTLISLPVGAVLGYGLAWLLVLGFETELYRMPLIVGRSTYAVSMLVVLASAFISGVIVVSRINKLDLIAVLKTRD